jgi:D-lactate dehydrogenase (cytochrome)
MIVAAVRTNDFLHAIAAIVGSDHVSSDIAACELAGADLVQWDNAIVPALVVTPGDTAQVAAIVSIAARESVAMVPRGAGLSYTGGVSAHVAAMAIDLSRLDSIDIDAGNLFAVVGAGCTWQRLTDALAPHGLRSVLTGPISGSHSTIGGAVSQGVPGSMEGVLGVTAVLTDGTVARTGSWGLPSSVAFSRQHGPDLTGLLIGDCGAFAIKTAVSLRLAPIQPLGFESYGFETSTSLLAAMTEIMRQGLASRVIAFDRMKAKGARPQGVRETLDTVLSVARRADGVRQMVRDVVGLHKVGGELAEAAWSLHITIGSPTEAGVNAQAQEVRRIGDRQGRRMEPAVPRALQAKPYSIRGFLGPNGERWAPVHGIFPLSRLSAAMTAMETHVEARRGEMERHGVTANWLLSSSGAYAVIEPMFYWFDALDPLHLRHLSERNRQRFANHASNPAARALVNALRRDLRDVMDRHGATHTQIGRFYRLPDALDAGSAGMLRRIKTALDPNRIMNPGVLGL